MIIDVREGWEHQRAHIEGSLHIPMQSIPGRLGELDPAAAYVLVCHHGMRSYQVAEFMARHGFERLYNLSGGIDAWASAVEPGMARY
ncbi:MAG: sulfurtransferase [Proteobacteria bacterium]|nr:sulfurtransferase [Burkholderiales bacterium]